MYPVYELLGIFTGQQLVRGALRFGALMRRFGGSARGMLRFRVKGGVFRALSKNGDEIAKVVDGKLQPTKFIEDGVVIKEMPESVLVRKGEEIGFKAATKRTTRSIDDILVNGKVPGVRNSEFTKWFDNLTLEELELIWKNSSIQKIIKARIRQPGKLHEWCMVCETPKFKSWGVSMKEIKRFRTKISELKWKHPDTGLPGQHGGNFSGKFHNELQEIIVNSKSLEEFNLGISELIKRWGIDPSLIPELPKPF